MPLGIISQDEFESELSNCVDNSINPANLINPRASNNSHQEIPKDSDLNFLDSNDLLPEEQSSKPATIITRPRGRGEASTQVPSGIRKIIGETSVINGRTDAVELANMFGISKSSVSAYKEGAHSTATINEPNKNTKSFIDASKLRVSTRARRKLNLALTHITEDKLSEAKVGEIASVAKSMAGIIKDMEPSTEGDKNKTNTPFVVFAPVIMNELSFETIHANDDY